MAMRATAGRCGEDVRNDCWVELTDVSSDIRVDSSILPLYGKQIESEARSALRGMGVEGLGAHIVDSGAFPFCIRARVESAALKLGVPEPLAVHPSFPARGLGAPSVRRTRLYLPGNTPKYFINAALHGPDAVILDLEDSVPPDEKEDARSLVRHALAELDFGTCERMVRVNSGEAGAQDIASVAGAGADTLLIPKAEDPAEIAKIQADLKLIPLLETAKGILRAGDIAAASPKVVAIAIGVEDYLSDIGATRAEPDALAFALGQVLNAARANGVQALASVWTDLEDAAGYELFARKMAGLGFEGVGCLHPSQIALAMRAFEPTPEEVAAAERIVGEYAAKGGAILVDGRMVDAPVAARAHRLLSRASNSLPNWRLV